MLVLRAPSRLDTHARLNGPDPVDRDAVNFSVFATIGVDAQVGAVGVFTAEVQEVDAGEDGQEAAEQRDGVDCVGGVESAEEDEGGDEGEGREGDVVEGVDATQASVVSGCVQVLRVGGVDVHISTILAQRLVEVIHLRENADYDNNGEDVGRGVRELVVAADCQLERNPEAFDGHDGDAADGAADGDVDHGVFLAVLGGDLVNHDHREECDHEAVKQKAYTLSTSVLASQASAAHLPGLSA